VDSTGTRIRYVELDEARSVSMYAIGDLQQSLKRVGMECIGRRKANAPVPRLLAKLGLARSYFQSTKKAFFACMMGPSESFLVPYCFAMKPIVYCFDCWPSEYAWWEGFLRRHKIKCAFFSAKQSAAFFSERLPGLDAMWIPEATDLKKYDPSAPLEARSIHVLELGRRYERLHAQITDALSKGRLIHQYAASGIVFKTRGELCRGLADTRISICFPRSMTHPDSAGQVETVTQRYFESMASGCLVYGHCPRELRDLFGYNPVIEMDVRDPVGQILALVESVGAHQPLVNKNLARVSQVGTWDSRAANIKRKLDRLELDALLLQRAHT